MSNQTSEQELELISEIKEVRLMLEDEYERLTLGQQKHLLLVLERAEQRLRDLKAQEARNG